MYHHYSCGAYKIALIINVVKKQYNKVLYYNKKDFEQNDLVDI